MEFQLSYFTSWKMMLWKRCTQYASKSGKLSSGHRIGKGQFSFQSQRKAMPKNVQFYRTIALISHTSKVMFKIFQARLQQYVNRELPDVQAGFRKGRGIRDQIANISGSSEKAIATHSSTLAWKIPWMEEPGRLQSMGSLRVGHDWVTSLSLFTFMHWRRK